MKRVFTWKLISDYSLRVTVSLKIGITIKKKVFQFYNEELFVFSKINVEDFFISLVNDNADFNSDFSLFNELMTFFDEKSNNKVKVKEFLKIEELENYFISTLDSIHKLNCTPETYSQIIKSYKLDVNNFLISKKIEINKLNRKYYDISIERKNQIDKTKIERQKQIDKIKIEKENLNKREIEEKLENEYQTKILQYRKHSEIANIRIIIQNIFNDISEVINYEIDTPYKVLIENLILLNTDKQKAFIQVPYFYEIQKSYSLSFSYDIKLILFHPFSFLEKKRTKDLNKKLLLFTDNQSNYCYFDFIHSHINSVIINIYSPCVDRIFFRIDENEGYYFYKEIKHGLRTKSSYYLTLLNNEDYYGMFIHKSIFESLHFISLKPFFKEGKRFDVFDNFEIIDFCFLPQPKTILKNIEIIIEILNNIEINKVINDFINPYINKFQQEIDTLNENYKLNEIEYLNRYFDSKLIYNLALSHLDVVYKKNSNHQFVSNQIIDFSDYEFGNVAEHSLYKFLLNESSIWDYKTDSYPEIYLLKLTSYKLELTWNNKTSESYLPFDLMLKWEYMHRNGNEFPLNFKIESKVYRIEVKATRNSNDAIFYMSVNELRELLIYKKNYLIARMVHYNNERYEPMNGIKVNDEFLVNFYYFNEHSINYIEEMIEDWCDIYKEKKIKFTIEHLINITNNFDDTLINLKKWETDTIYPNYNRDFRDFINKNYYFNDIEPSINELMEIFIEAPNFHEKIKDKLNKIKELLNSDKFNKIPTKQIKGFSIKCFR